VQFDEKRSFVAKKQEHCDRDDPADEVIVYAPTPGFTGTDSFTYTISDPAGVESTGTVTLTETAQSVNPSATSFVGRSWGHPLFLSFREWVDPSNSRRVGGPIQSLRDLVGQDSVGASAAFKPSA